MAPELMQRLHLDGKLAPTTALHEIGIDYRGAPDWPTELDPNSPAIIQYGGHEMPAYRAYVVEVVSRRLRLLDPTQDIAALRIMLADVQTIIGMGMSKKGRAKSTLPASKMLLVMKAYALWCDMVGLSYRAAWDAEHVRGVIGQLGAVLKGSSSVDPRLSDIIIEARAKLKLVRPVEVESKDFGSA